MSFTLTRKALLAGTALVAVSLCLSTASFAADGAQPSADTTISVPTTGTAGTTGATGNPGVTGTAGDDGVQAITNNNFTITNASTITGGAGGTGGAGLAVTNTGGVGGVGGFGVNLPTAVDGTSTTTHLSVVNNATRSITGGAGGVGGAGGGLVSNGGLGGAAGAGVSADSNFATINNAGTITGGAGGVGGAGTTTGVNGNGGAGAAGISVIANNVAVTNSGAIVAGAGGAAGTGGAVAGTAGAAGNAVDITALALNASVTNAAAGTITATTGNGINIASTATGASVNNAGGITTTTGTGVNIAETLGALGFVNSGTINATSGSSVTIASGKSATVFTNSGTIGGGTGAALNVQGTLGTFNNAAGTLTSSGAKTIVLGANQTAAGNLVLNGTISNTQASTGAIAVSVEANQTVNNLVNTGTIRADGGGAANSGLGIAVDFGTFTGTFNNQGTVYGQVTGTTGAQTFTNSAGTFVGVVNLGADANNLNLSGGTVTGNLIGTTGVNTVNISGGTLTGNVILGAGGNTINVSGGAVNGGISATTGSDTLVLSGGTVTGTIDLSDGTNAITLSGGNHIGALLTGTGADTLLVSGGNMTGNVNLSDGANSATFSSGTLTGGYTGGTGVDALTFSGGSQVGTIALLGGTNTIAFNNDYTTTGTISAVGGTDNVTIAAGKTLTANHVLSELGNLAVGTASILNVNQTTVATAGAGALTNAGTINVAAAKTLDVYNYTTGTGAFHFNVNQAAGAMTVGSLNADNGAVNLAGTSVVFVVDANAGSLPGNTASFVTSTSGATSLTGATFSDTSMLYDFTTADAGTNLTVTAARVSGGLQGLATAGGSDTGNENNAAVGGALDGLTGSTDPGIAAIQARLAAASTQQQIDDTLESLTPTVDGSVNAAANAVTDQTANLTQTRMAALRSSDGREGGVNTGDGMADNRLWVKPFAVHINQDRRDGIDGYDADTLGLTIGGDTHVSPDAVLGLALSYGNTDTDSENANATEADIDSYQFQVYGDYDLGNRAFVQGSVGYGWNQVDQSRFNVGGVPGATATSDYDTQQFIAGVGIGQTFMPMNDGLMLTPQAGVRYTHLSTDNYTEAGPGGLNVNTDDVDALELGVGAELAYDVRTESGVVQPSAHVGYTFDAINDDIQTASAFTAGGASFTTNGADPSSSTFNAGAGLTYYSNDSVDLSLNYDAQVKSDYVAHAGYLKAVTKF